MPALDVSELNVVISALGISKTSAVLLLCAPTDTLGGFMVLYGVISVKIKNVWYLGEACTSSRSGSENILLRQCSTSSSCRHHIGPDVRKVPRCHRMGSSSQGPAGGYHTCELFTVVNQTSLDRA